MNTQRLRIAVLVSGGGRTLEYLVDASRAGEIDCDVACCIATSLKCGALDRAARLAVPVKVLRPRDFADPAAFSTAVFDDLEANRVDLALLAGFLVRLPLRAAWRGRVMNIHPALLPSFGGRGFYGHHVHEAVLKAGVKVTGCTVHFVDDEYDHGPIIAQRCVPVRADDDADAIAARVFEQERIAYLDAINRYAAGRLRIENGRVHEVEPDASRSP